MIKVARISIVGFDNYGCILQNYALEKVLTKFGEVHTLFDNDKAHIYEFNKYRWNIKLFIKFIINKNNVRKFFSRKTFLFEVSRMVRCKEFCNQNLNIRYDIDFEKINDEYDFFVVGSDQVWNTGGIQRFDRFRKRKVSDIKFLKFVSPSKRIAYAASIAQPDIPPALRESFIESVCAMKDVSVREVEGAQLIQKYTGRTVEVVADPTMLLTSVEWEKLERKPIWLDEKDKYLFTYFLGKRIGDVIQKVASENNLKIINMLDFENFDHYTTSPEEWIYLIHHAEFVYTDSFHGTVFSILFKKPFVVCNRIGSGIYSKMTSRIDTLLGKFDLEDRRGTKENGYMIADPLHIQYGDVDAVLAEDRRKADKYLRRALDLDKT